MASFVFNDSASLSLVAGTNFNTATDTISIAVAPGDLTGASFTPIPGGTGVGTLVFTTATGATLTLNNVSVDVGDPNFVGSTAGAPSTVLSSPIGPVVLGNTTTAGAYTGGNLNVGFGLADTFAAAAGAGGITFGGDGANGITGAAATTSGEIIYGGTGLADTIDAGDSIAGSNFSDTIYGNGGDDVIAGGSGADLINGGIGNDTISGPDSLGLSPIATAFSAGTVLYGAAGDDVITAGPVAAFAGSTDGITIFGGSGITDSTDVADTLTGGTGADTIYGNGGNDSIAGGGGADSINGGVGNDTISGDFDGPTAGAASSSAVIAGAGGSDSIDASTSTQGLTIFGGSGITDSADGADTIVGGAGADTIYGNGGDDSILGGLAGVRDGADSINGGGGNDTISGDFDDSTAGSASPDSASGAMLFGAAGSDSINASASTQGLTIFGGSGVSDSADGSDTVFGGSGSDSIFGNGGDDVILTDGGADAINGGAGNDVIFDNGFGQAQLTGAGGDNVFAFGATAAPLPVGTYTGTTTAHATITDFTQGSDLIDVGSTSAVTSVLASSSVAALQAASLGANQVAYAPDGSGNELVGWVAGGGVGAANTFIALRDSDTALTTSDFTHGTTVA